METPVCFAVVIPMYNEELGVEKCVRTVCQALDSFTNRTALIAVNDGSHDQTGIILSQLEHEYPRLIVVTHEKNQGYGCGVKTGVRRAAELKFHYVLFMDSDLTNDPKYLPLFVERMEQGFDVIKASRYIKGGAMAGVPAWRRTISIVGNRIARLLYGLPINDCTNGFRALKTNLLQQMSLQESGFVIIMEELYQARFLAKTFCEVPYTLTARSETARPSSFVYRPKIFYDYLKYAIKSFLHNPPVHIKS
jgi:dolichol-phosphate mannosyltransferase